MLKHLSVALVVVFNSIFVIHKLVMCVCDYIFSPIPLFTAANLKIWFKGMRAQYGKLTAKKSGDGTKEHTKRDRWITFIFLKDHISRVPSRQSATVSIHS